MAIKISPSYTVEVGYDEFCGALAARDLQPLWKMAKQLMPGKTRIDYLASRR